MDNATEGTRTLNFMVADLSGVFDDDQSVIEGLKEVLNSPPSGKLTLHGEIGELIPSPQSSYQAQSRQYCLIVSGY